MGTVTMVTVTMVTVTEGLAGSIGERQAASGRFAGWALEGLRRSDLFPLMGPLVILN